MIEKFFKNLFLITAQIIEAKFFNEPVIAFIAVDLLFIILCHVTSNLRPMPLPKLNFTRPGSGLLLTFHTSDDVKVFISIAVN